MRLIKSLRGITFKDQNGDAWEVLTINKRNCTCKLRGGNALKVFTKSEVEDYMEEIFPPGKYKATVSRRTWSDNEFEVETDRPLTKEELENKFLELGYNHEFPSGRTSDYVVEDIGRLK